MSYVFRYNAIRPAIHALAAVVALASALPAGDAFARPVPGRTDAPVLSLDAGAPSLVASGEPASLVLSNGIQVTFFSADLLASRVTVLQGVPIIPLDTRRYVTIIDDINDPAIYNKGDGSFHPFAADLVIDALEQVHQPGTGMEITVYALPYPRRNLLVSSTSGFELFLSPHVLDIQTAVGAYIVTHELGHAFHNRFLPDASPRWLDYRRVRGILDTSKFSDSAPHAYRPREIFAEDFRVLFGGVDAVYGGNIENTEIASPFAVAGLEPFMVSLVTTRTRARAEVAAVSYPNPFNPTTTIRVDIPEGEAGITPVSVRVYDVRGALVSELFSGAAPSRDLEIHWDGTDGRGNRVASATYYALVRVGEAKRSLKLVMLK